VRLLRYVLLEVALVVAALYLSGAALGWAGRRLARALEARQRAQLALRYPPRQDISVATDPAIAVEPAGVFLGMSDDLLLRRARTEAITRVKVNRGGSSLSFRVDFADGSRAAFKPAQTNLQTIPRKEVAAYRLNRLLGLNAVPPAAARAVTRDELLGRLHPDSQPALPRIQAQTIFNPLGKTAGVVSYWIPEIRDSGLDTPEGIREGHLWLTQGTFIPEEKRALAAQLSDLVLFDFLTANPDRYSGGNIKMSPDGAQIYFMDNTMAFYLAPEGHLRNRTMLQRTQRFSRHLWHALGRITEAELDRLMTDETETGVDEVLTQGEIRAVVARREAAQRHIDAVAGQYGADKVLVFP
jgi:hypothetical protein